MSSELFSALVLRSGGTLRNCVAKAAMEEGWPAMRRSRMSGSYRCTAAGAPAGYRAWLETRA